MGSINNLAKQKIMRTLIIDIDLPSPYIGIATTNKHSKDWWFQSDAGEMTHSGCHAKSYIGQWGTGKVHLNAVVDQVGRNKDVLNCMKTKVSTQFKLRHQRTI